MALVKRESTFPVISLRKEMDRLLDEFIGERWPSVFEPAVFVPPVEVGETPEEVFVNVQVPGLNKEDLELELADGTLTVSGKVEEEKEDKKKNYYRQEIRRGRFSRTITLPGEVESNKATADLKKGVLMVHIPKTEKAKKRAVTVAIQ
ncbi:MAG TPA: Hsp20/alpha crystallin family protein [Vicinamibacteria bacterium]|nr:Hsp20/alpha crystallin family protein [Vicinamibacteria bacterium]